MAGLRDPFRYREEAERFLALADTHADHPLLRDGYLALAIQFERLADILEKTGAVEDSRQSVDRQNNGKTRSQS
ncbi:MAG: hypothetical protein JO162_04925 [Alphaproteobacteria bacterium]|nr:hypothetical protein [Alphaproteobacteria bacterium]MBV9014887.1 hypothetical protein [Alphaproteobacteria bacterium]MBV9152620.1 hypothetical protein [Alphaproteobacteria bacterium]MBV9584414.1 hypothetical protein [Alphaproteobacteria bacterium]